MALNPSETIQDRVEETIQDRVEYNHYSCLIIPISDVKNNNIDAETPVYFAFITPIQTNTPNSDNLITCKGLLNGIDRTIVLYQIIVNSRELRDISNGCPYALKRYKIVYISPLFAKIGKKELASYVMCSQRSILKHVQYSFNTTDSKRKWYLTMCLYVAKEHDETLKRMSVFSLITYINILWSLTDVVAVVNENDDLLGYIRQQQQQREGGGSMEDASKLLELVKHVYTYSLELFVQFNNVTKNGFCKGTVENVFFFDYLDTHFKSPLDVINFMRQTENKPLEAMIGAYFAKIMYYNREYINVLKRYYQKRIDFERYQEEKCTNYRIDDTATSSFVVSQLSRKLLEPIRDRFNDNINRTVNNIRWGNVSEPVTYVLTDSKPIEWQSLKGYSQKPIVFSLNNYKTSIIHSITRFDYPLLHNKAVKKAIQNHVKKPTMKTYLRYCQKYLHLVSKLKYDYSEVIIPNSTIYCLSLDIDIHTRDLIRDFYHSNHDGGWRVRKYMHNLFKTIVITFMTEFIGLDDYAPTTQFALYESANDQAFPSKVGLRFIARSSKYVFKNSDVVSKIIEGINYYAKQFYVNVTGPSDIIDENVFATAYHKLRLPLNLKNNNRLLLPIYVNDDSSSVIGVPSFGLVHHKSCNYNDNSVIITSIPSVKDSLIFRQVSTDFVLNLMAKRRNNAQNRLVFKNYTQAITKLLPIIRKAIINIVGESYKEMVEKKFQTVTKNKSIYIIANNVPLCISKRHQNVMNNPCRYYAVVYRHARQMYVSVQMHCFGTQCGKQRFMPPLLLT